MYDTLDYESISKDFSSFNKGAIQPIIYGDRQGLSSYPTSEQDALSYIALPPGPTPGPATPEVFIPGWAAGGGSNFSTVPQRMGIVLSGTNGGTFQIEIARIFEATVDISHEDLLQAKYPP